MNSSLISNIFNRANQEKYFYSALRKYHTDQLENYQPSAHYAVAHSNSDHHHNTRHSPTRQDLDELPTKQHKRSKSGYSILNNEHLYSKHSFYESPGSEASYDPFRASKQPIVSEQAIVRQNVTIHRGHGSGSGSGKVRPATAMGHRTGSSLRIQALRNNSKRSSAMSRGSSNRSTPSHRALSVKQRSMSRSSMASSHWPSSPPVVVRSGGLGKRGVSFTHLRDRRSSGATASTWETDGAAHTDYARSHRPHTSIGSYGSSLRSSTARPSPALLPHARGTASLETPRLRLRKPDSPSKYIQGEARKVSMELGKVMEEAFNRSSVGSSIRTSGTGADLYHDASMYDTPPTSFSNTRDSGGSTLATPKTKVTLAQRPLPPIPSETPNTFLQRKLAETRAEIARRLDEDGDNTEHFNEVLEHLDRLMVPGGNTKRTVSAPAKSPEHPAPLHVIPEEDKGDGDGFFTQHAQGRAVTDPVRPRARRGVTEQEQTIRLVTASPTIVAPLNIRKRSGVSVSSKTTNDVSSMPWPGPASQSTVRPFQDVQNDLIAARTKEPTPALEKQNTVIKKKKSLWFRREKDDKEQGPGPQIKEKQSTGLLQIPAAWHGLDDRIKIDHSNDTNTNTDIVKHTQKESEGSNESEFPIRNSGAATTKGDGAILKGLFGLFGKKSKGETSKKPMELGGTYGQYEFNDTNADVVQAVNFSSSSILSGFDLGPDDSANRTGPPDMQKNWLSRFLHIKPASKTLCFHIGRGKVRQDLVRLLRDWQRFGVKDVSVDRETNIISGRVDKNNRTYCASVSPRCLLNGWRLQGWCFDLNVLHAKMVMRCVFWRPFSCIVILVVLC